MLIPYEQLYIQNYHHNCHLIPEQSTEDINPLIQIIIDTSHTDRNCYKTQYRTIHQPKHPTPLTQNQRNIFPHKLPDNPQNLTSINQPPPHMVNGPEQPRHTETLAKSSHPATVNAIHTRHYTPRTPATERVKLVSKPHSYSE